MITDQVNLSDRNGNGQDEQKEDVTLPGMTGTRDGEMTAGQTADSLAEREKSQAVVAGPTGENEWTERRTDGHRS